MKNVSITFCAENEPGDDYDYVDQLATSIRRLLDNHTDGGPPWVVLESILVNIVDDEATMGVPPDGETALDVANDRYNEKYDPTTDYHDAVSDYDPLYSASELLARNSERLAEQNERIITLLEEVADNTSWLLEDQDEY